MGSTPIDAVVSFAAGGLLMPIGLLVVLRGGLISRTLGFLISILAIMWAALIVFLLSSFNHDIDHLMPAVSFARDLQIGYFLTAGGAVVGFLGGLIGISVPSRAKVMSRPAMTPPASRPDATMPRAGAGAAPMRPPASLWTPDNSVGATPAGSRTPAEVGSGRSPHLLRQRPRR
jgi:hypothetical protein